MRDPAVGGDDRRHIETLQQAQYDDQGKRGQADGGGRVPASAFFIEQCAQKKAERDEY